MRKEILSAKQLELLPLVEKFKPEFFLAGGTAIALHLGHRRSIDFDLFKFTGLKHKRIIDTITQSGNVGTIIRKVDEQLDVIVNGVKLTFLEFPFEIMSDCRFENYIKLPELLSLAAMKAYALGRRSKWKDYVDMYFIIRDYFSIGEITQAANRIFNPLFSEKMFRAQLCYFDDIDHSEAVDFVDKPVSDEVIKGFLTDRATQIL